MTHEYIDDKSRFWDDPRAQANGDVPLQISSGQEAERAVSIAAALLGDRDIVEPAVNLPNEGRLPDLPATAVVEVPAVVAHAPLLDQFGTVDGHDPQNRRPREGEL
ncbi:family 4 glycosyl hydrolase [Actinoallomurus acaciae]|uniref:Glycosyl hydrolase family 4 C-terminal domain-containing protein n=1 Tax=Actinoallomurus acaciae TaxID=502577 RepID=A0ABV5Y8T3_9ACTN